MSIIAFFHSLISSAYKKSDRILERSFHYQNQRDRFEAENIMLSLLDKCKNIQPNQKQIFVMGLRPSDYKVYNGIILSGKSKLVWDQCVHLAEQAKAYISIQFVDSYDQFVIVLSWDQDSDELTPHLLKMLDHTLKMMRVTDLLFPSNN